ncbi:BamA/TamA family outer membrane protein [Flavobacterium soyangense]|nr:outer membrane protein assembly factor [Flavobacterium soyangense]
MGFSQENTIGKIDFLGTKKMNIDFIKNLIQTKSGGILDSLTIKKDIQVLQRLNGISKVNFSVIKTFDNLYSLSFTLIENFTIIPYFSASTTSGFGAYRVGLYEYNFLGKNNTIGGFYQFNEYNSGGINFSSPQFFNSKFGFEINIQKLISKEPVYINEAKSNYKYTNTSFEVLTIFQVNYQNQLKLGVVLFNEKYNYIDGAKFAEISQNFDINKQLVKAEYSFDNVNFDFYLVNGFKSNLVFQYVVPNSNSQKKFLIGWNDFLYYKRLGSKGNWVSRLRLGLATNNNNPFAPFPVDNNLNIRGVGNIIDRGTGAIIFNTEFRKTILEEKRFVLQGNAFIDSGTWRNAGGDFSDFTSQKNIRVYPGLGIRFIHKTIFNAVFRLDYGYGITKDASNGFVFGIGQYF